MLALTASATPVTLEENADGTRAMGLRQGTHAVGFEVIEGEDRTRHINRTEEGTRLGLALWYPARRATKRQPSMTTMDYRLTRFSGSPTKAQRKMLEDEEVTALLGCTLT